MSCHGVGPRGPLNETKALILEEASRGLWDKSSLLGDVSNKVKSDFQIIP